MISANAKDSDAGMGDAGVATLLDTIDHVLWTADADGRPDFFNRRWYEFTGIMQRRAAAVDWLEFLHPEDRIAIESLWLESLVTGASFRFEARLHHHEGGWRWMLGSVECDASGVGGARRFVGTLTDIHELKTTDMRRELIARELSHRIRNVFAVVSSLVMLAAREQPEARPFAMSAQQRIQALAVAHDYLRPTSPADPAEPRTVQGLLSLLAAPHNVETTPRIVIAGEDHAIALPAATAIALIVHELITNAVKYGALATETGVVTIDCHADGGRYGILWRERGGPPILGVPERRGFGSTLSERVASLQLDAALDREWNDGGLVVRIAIPSARLAA